MTPSKQEAGAIRQVVSDKVTEPSAGMWSNCLVAGDMLFVSGLTARNGALQPTGGDAFDQAMVIFERMQALVEAAGGTMADVVKLTIFVTNIGERRGVWKARQEFFSGAFPAASLVEVSSLAEPEITVEIEAIGVLHRGGRPAAAR